jgi:1-acyl-sn-glycerol-3-phosphate acyltransferase
MLAEEMLRPTPEQLATLDRFERIAFEIADQVNRRPALKRAAHAFLSSVGRTWVRESTKNLVHMRGEEVLTELDPDRGVFLVANHRSFFDFYVVSSVVLRLAPWVDRLYFPVRSSFFYERPLGVFVNAVMSAMAMYPPVMRDGPKRAFNQYTVDLIAELVRERGTVVGFHPEGTRGKSDNPYELLPANVGTGSIVYQARPIVLPVFTLGLINDFPKQVRSNFDGTGAPITIQFGKPLDLEEFYAMPARLSTYKLIADRIRDALTELGQKERAMREELGLPKLGP